jgi:hypothetical protein
MRPCRASNDPAIPTWLATAICLAPLYTR